MSLKPACAKCQRFYRPKKNGFPFIESMPKFGEAPSGTERPDLWKPYKLWVGDLWECKGCGHELIIGALSPVKEHYMFDFDTTVERTEAHLGKPLVRINDC